MSDESARLRARIAELEEALRPFAAYADTLEPFVRDECAVKIDPGQASTYCNLGDCRRARAALRKE